MILVQSGATGAVEALLRDVVGLVVEYQIGARCARNGSLGFAADCRHHLFRAPQLRELNRVVTHRAGAAGDQDILPRHAAIDRDRVICGERGNAEARACREIDAIRQPHLPAPTARR
jgi:hypothetical protein